MLERGSYLGRVKSLLAKLAEKGLKGAIILGSSNILYFTGTDAASALVVGEGGECILLASRLEYTRALDEAKVGAVYAYSELEAPTASYERVIRADLYGALRKALEELGLEPARVGVTVAQLSYKAYCRLKDALGGEPADVSPLVSGMRAVKSREELSLIMRAIEVAEASMKKVLSALERGVREYELAALAVSEIRARGAIPAFEPIVAFGEHAAHPHAKPGSRELREGDVVKVDLGAKVGGYCSDITRTAALGEPPQKLRSVLRAVVKAQEEAIHALTKSVAARDVDAKAREVMRSEGLLEYFIHGLGHGIGLDVHEAPSLSPGSRDMLEAGMVATVEPGVYIRGVGGVRVEDDVLVMEDGARVLSKLDKLLF